MEQIDVIEDPIGTYSCDIGLTVKDWETILTDKKITMSTYRFALMAFYNEPEHKSTCKNLGIKYYGDSKKAQKYNSLITNFGKSVVRNLNRFKIIDHDGSEKFWHIAMDPGKYLDNGLFEWTLRPEIVQAIENLGWNEHSTWLVGYSFSGTESQYDRFIEEGVWECHFSDSVKSDQSLLKLASTIKANDIIVLKSTSTKGSRHDLPFMRLKAVGVVLEDIDMTTKDDITICTCRVNYISTEEKDFESPTYGSYRKTIHQADDKAKEVIEYVNSLLGRDIKKSYKYGKYIELLKEAHNLVLTGAPGTGKTFMAQAMAKEMGAEMKFVQFHPSYDYTDFVEGLRPVDNGNGQIGFERRNGVFKDFCRDAIKNLLDSKKSVASLSSELSWRDNLMQFASDAIENGTYYKTITGSEFSIIEMTDDAIIILNEQNVKNVRVVVSISDITDLLVENVQLNNVHDIRKFFNRTYGTQPDSYAFVIVNEVKKLFSCVPAVSANKVEEKPFVFIIDEINRGEVSKIFGELFYAVDPGYRGKSEICVQTQYQNLVPETDVFAKGFYVPKNVYILATMNDIDRSVESMDFAMRRRFTWNEVLPTDTQEMLDKMDLSLAAKAKEMMNRLNGVIADDENLGSAYMIGASYFMKLEENGGDFEKLWRMNLEPLLREYLRGSRNSDETINKFKQAYFG